MYAYAPRLSATFATLETNDMQTVVSWVCGLAYLLFIQSLRLSSRIIHQYGLTVPRVALAADENERGVRAEFFQLRNPLQKQKTVTRVL